MGFCLSRILLRHRRSLINSRILSDKCISAFTLLLHHLVLLPFLLSSRLVIVKGLQVKRIVRRSHLPVVPEYDLAEDIFPVLGQDVF